jgi:hypothetical protein
MESTKPGTKLVCSGCGTEVVVIKASGSAPECCGAPLTSSIALKAAGNDESAR